MTRFELYYGGTNVDVDVVSAMRCPMPHEVNTVHEFKDTHWPCLDGNDGYDCSPVKTCRTCWERELNENDLPEVAYILAHRYSDLGLTMIDFVHIGQIMLSNDCTFKEAVSTYYDQMAERICKEE